MIIPCVVLIFLRFAPINSNIYLGKLILLFKKIPLAYLKSVQSFRRTWVHYQNVSLNLNC